MRKLLCTATICTFTSNANNIQYSLKLCGHIELTWVYISPFNPPFPPALHSVIFLSLQGYQKVFFVKTDFMVWKFKRIYDQPNVNPIFIHRTSEKKHYPPWSGVSTGFFPAKKGAKNPLSGEISFYVINSIYTMRQDIMIVLFFKKKIWKNLILNLSLTLYTEFCWIMN